MTGSYQAVWSYSIAFYCYCFHLFVKKKSPSPKGKSHDVMETKQNNEKISNCMFWSVEDGVKINMLKSVGELIDKL